MEKKENKVSVERQRKMEIVKHWIKMVFFLCLGIIIVLGSVSIYKYILYKNHIYLVEQCNHLDADVDNLEFVCCYGCKKDDYSTYEYVPNPDYCLCDGDVVLWETKKYPVIEGDFGFLKSD